MTEKCVFSALVKSDDDAEGILAYGAYKYKKLEEAKSLAKSGKSPEQIEKLLKEYHDRFFDNQYEIGKVKEAAIIILSALRVNARETLAESHRREIERINGQHNEEVTKLKKGEDKRTKAAIKKDRDEWKAKVDKTRLADHNIFIRFLLYAWSGFPSAVATFLGYAIFTFVLIVFFTPSDKREEAYNKAASEGKQFLRIGKSSESHSSEKSDQ